jgi:hypothetical protein
MAMTREITASREVVDFDERGNIRRLLHIEYVLKNGDVTYGPFSVEVPKKQWSPQVLIDDAKAQEKWITEFQK